MMRSAQYPDCLVVVNGPEDGAEFPIARTPLKIGRDAACVVNLRLDDAVRPVHAVVTVVSDGYRIRRADTAPVYVNGKRAGIFRSRIMRSGGIVQVGNTELCLECAPDGLASRSHGVIGEIDLSWTWPLKQGFRTLLSLLLGILAVPYGILRSLLRSWLVIIAVVILLYMFWPRFRHNVVYYLNYALWKVRLLFQQ